MLNRACICSSSWLHRPRAGLLSCQVSAIPLRFWYSYKGALGNPGGGVNEDNLATLIHTTGVRAVHASASCRVTSAMQVRSVAMGPAESDVGSWNECSYNRVRKLVDIAAECSQ